MQSRQPVQVVQGLFGDLQLSYTHDHDDDEKFDILICNTLPHKVENASHCLIGELDSSSQSSFLPTMEFSSDDLRSQNHYSFRRFPRPSGDLGIRFGSQCSERAQESKSSNCDKRTSSPRTTARSMEKCISSLRRFAGKLEQLLKSRWLRSSQSKR